MKPIEIQVTTQFQIGHLQDILVSAFEGGSNYWIDAVRYIYADGVQHSDFDRGGRYHDPEWSVMYQLPFIDGCGLEITVSEDYDGTVRVLNRESIADGLVRMQEWPRHFANMLPDGDADAETGDVFLQCCVLDGIIFG
jgi:hypothetical protein